MHRRRRLGALRPMRGVCNGIQVNAWAQGGGLGPLAQDEPVRRRGHMGRTPQRHALRAGVRRARRSVHALPGHAAIPAGCPDPGGFSRQADDAQRIKPELQLARVAVIDDHGLEEQLEGAEGLGNKRRSQTGSKSATGAALEFG
jgi:hypothetical protein